MAAGDAHAAGPLDTVHREMDIVVHSRHVYKSVHVITSNRKTTRPREGACWPIHMINLQWQ